MCSCYLEKVKINELQKYFFYGIVEEMGLFKGGCGMTEYTKTGEKQISQNKKLSTHKLHCNNRLNGHLLSVCVERWKPWEQLERRLAVQLPVCMKLYLGIHCLMLVEDFGCLGLQSWGLVWVFFKGCQKILFIFRPFNFFFLKIVILGRYFYCKEGFLF